MREIDDFGFDEFGRPCKDLYFMNLCFTVNMRSLDINTKNGCVITDNDGGVLSTGYNSPIRNAIDENVPLTSPEKYDYFLHSEKNAILNAARNGIPLNNSVFYITGLPCINCLQDIIQVGASKIVYGPLTASMLGDPAYISKYQNILVGQNIRIKKFVYLKGLFSLNPLVENMVKDRKDITVEKV